MSFNHKQIEKKWQSYWLENKTFKTGEDMSKPKYFAMPMFPYPSIASNGLLSYCVGLVSVSPLSTVISVSPDVK